MVCIRYDNLRWAGLNRSTMDKYDNIIVQNLQEYIDIIQVPYNKFLSGETGIFAGPGPNVLDDNQIWRFLLGHSPREGIKNKFLNLIYRICESVKDFFVGRSDWRSARKEIAFIIQQANIIQNGEYRDDLGTALMLGTWPSQEETLEANRVLNRMLQNC